MKSIISRPALKTARKNALNFLSRRDHSISEIRKKLAFKQHSEDIISQVIDILVEEKLLDDEKFALSWGRFRTELCHYGPIRLRKEFQDKGLCAHIINKALHDIEAQYPSARIAQEALMRRYPHTRDLQASRLRQKAFAYLQRKGHRSDTITGIFRKLDENIDALTASISI